MSPPAIASFIFAPVVAPVISQGHFVAFVAGRVLGVPLVLLVPGVLPVRGVRHVPY